MVKIIIDRDNSILNAAIQLAEVDGYQWITREAVATLSGVSPGTVSNAYGTMRELKRAVLSAAIERRILPIVAQGLADGHALVRAAPEDIRKEAAALLLVA